MSQAQLAQARMQGYSLGPQKGGMSDAERKALKAEAHALSPVAAIGKAGVTPAVLKEIDLWLRSHALIKVRAGSDERLGLGVGQVRHSLLGQTQ
jgi:RNA-binding protein YhbY